MRDDRGGHLGWRVIERKRWVRNLLWGCVRSAPAVALGLPLGLARAFASLPAPKQGQKPQTKRGCWRYIDQLLCRALHYFQAIKHSSDEARPAANTSETNYITISSYPSPLFPRLGFHADCEEKIVQDNSDVATFRYHDPRPDGCKRLELGKNLSAIW